MSATLVLSLFFPALVIYAAVSDVLSLTIPNRVSLALAAAFFAMALAAGMSWPQIGWHVVAATIVFVAGFACFAFGWIGGGDAKVAAAAALWFGVPDTLSFLLASSIAGAVLTLMIIVLRRQPLPAWALGQAWLVRLHDRSNGVPYGVALAVGALILFPRSDWIVQAIS